MKTPIIPVWGQEWEPVDAPQCLGEFQCQHWIPDHITHSYAEAVLGSYAPVQVCVSQMTRHPMDVAVLNSENRVQLVGVGECSSDRTRQRLALKRLSFWATIGDPEGDVGVSWWTEGTAVRYGLAVNRRINYPEPDMVWESISPNSHLHTVGSLPDLLGIDTKHVLSNYPSLNWADPYRVVDMSRGRYAARSSYPHWVLDAYADVLRNIEVDPRLRFNEEWDLVVPKNPQSGYDLRDRSTRPQWIGQDCAQMAARCSAGISETFGLAIHNAFHQCEAPPEDQQAAHLVSDALAALPLNNISMGQRMFRKMLKQWASPDRVAAVACAGRDYWKGED